MNIVYVEYFSSMYILSIIMMTSLGYYRLMEPAGSYITEYGEVLDRCGAGVGGWLQANNANLLCKIQTLYFA